MKTLLALKTKSSDLLTAYCWRLSYLWSSCQTTLLGRIKAYWSFGCICQMIFWCTFSSFCLQPVYWKLLRSEDVVVSELSCWTMDIVVLLP